MSTQNKVAQFNKLYQRQPLYEAETYRMLAQREPEKADPQQQKRHFWAWFARK